MEDWLNTKVFGVKWSRLLTNIQQTLYMVGWALLIGTVVGLLLALLLVLTRKGGILKGKTAAAVHTVLNLYVNIVRSVPFVILLVTIMPFTRLLMGTTIGSTAALVPLVLYISPYLARLMANADRQDGLAFNSDHPNRVGFGFEDSVHMTGKLAYCSVLYYDASVRALAICRELDLDPSVFEALARGVKNAFLPAFWDGTALHASTGLCSGQFDVLAAAYAVSCGLVEGKEARAVVDAFWKYNDELQVNGFYKYVPEAFYQSPEQVWESANQYNWAHVDIYQWGGFWTIGTPHILHAVLKTKGRKAVAPMVDALSRYVQENGLFEECRNRDGSWRNALYYVQTLSAVDAVLRMWAGEPWTY